MQDTFQKKWKHMGHDLKSLHRHDMTSDDHSSIKGMGLGMLTEHYDWGFSHHKSQVIQGVSFPLQFFFCCHVLNIHDKIYNTNCSILTSTFHQENRNKNTAYVQCGPKSNHFRTRRVFPLTSMKIGSGPYPQTNFFRADMFCVRIIIHISGIFHLQR